MLYEEESRLEEIDTLALSSSIIFFVTTTTFRQILVVLGEGWRIDGMPSARG
jgi:hypothetical protein